MKKMELMKTIQLIVFGILAAAAIVVVVADNGRNLRLANILLWISLALSFFFIFLDFNFYDREEKKYDKLVRDFNSDSMTKVGNRYSIDKLIDKYMNEPLPADFGCVVLTISNIREINEAGGREEGNAAIRRFSLILKMASVGHCFIGRNGGNKFVAMFENGSEESIRHFISRITQKVSEYNADSSNTPLAFEYGIAFHEDGVNQVTDMISLADQRVGQQTVS
ncbi:MAG: diguanylate cyclase domain-containing protein [Bilifractor sp.]|jgi:diguanylate cyclase (GGDEF)-like protein